MRLFRQTVLDECDDVVMGVEKELSDWMSSACRR
jgi:hypothetical protein